MTAGAEGGVEGRGRGMRADMRADEVKKDRTIQVDGGLFTTFRM